MHKRVENGEQSTMKMGVAERGMQAAMGAGAQVTTFRSDSCAVSTRKSVSDESCCRAPQPAQASQHSPGRRRHSQHRIVQEDAAQQPVSKPAAAAAAGTFDGGRLLARTAHWRRSRGRQAGATLVRRVLKCQPRLRAGGQVCGQQPAQPEEQEVEGSGAAAGRAAGWIPCWQQAQRGSFHELVDATKHLARQMAAQHLQQIREGRQTRHRSRGIAAETGRLRCGSRAGTAWVHP